MTSGEQFNLDEGKDGSIIGSQTEIYLRTINEFAILISSLNQIEDIVWALAKYAIARLGFVDCVIYLLDQDRQILIQQAAHGRKNPSGKEILDPIEISLGHGVVGTAAHLGVAIRIEDTRLDARYIVDDELRLSELAVPMIHEGQTIGVIDSEHPDEGFFTELHQSILTTLAALAAPRIAFIIDAQQQISSSEMALLARTAELTKILHELQDAQEEALQARDEAQVISQAKSDFISNMSHELRTPLTSISGYAQLLLRDPNLTYAQRKGLTIINNSTRHMATMIENILDYSKQEYHGVALEPETVDFAKFLPEIGEILRLQASGKGVGFFVDVPDNLPHVIVDASRLRQALLNLLGNAIKFTTEGYVTLNVTLLPDDDQQATRFNGRFEVIDTGQGITAEDIDRIFIPFEQAGPRAHQIKGTGLGLPISQQIIQHFGGEIKVESRVGHGSRFWFDISLPLAKVERPPTPPESMVRKYQGERRTILVIDDLNTTLLLFRTMLSVLGFDVIEATTGAAGIATVAQNRPDLIIIDWMMPNMDGLETIKVLRDSGSTDIPIIMSSAYVANETEMARVLEIADGFLKKPIELSELQACLTRLLQLDWVK